MSTHDKETDEEDETTLGDFLSTLNESDDEVDEVEVEEAEEVEEDEDEDDDEVEAESKVADWNQVFAEMPDKPENWESLINAEEKRRKDSQSAFTKERQRAEQLERELRQLRETPTTTAATVTELADSVTAKYEELFAEDPQQAILYLAREQKAELLRLREQDRQQVYVESIGRQEQEMRRDHADYDDLVTDYLVNEMQKDSSLKVEWQNRGGTASAAYELAKSMKEFREFKDNPVAYRERIRNEIMEEQKKSKSRIGETLAGVTSEKGGSNGKARPRSVLDELFG